MPRTRPRPVRPYLRPMQHIPTRAAALAHLADFAPHTGARYAHGRNTDNGPGGHTDVSTFSPWIRRRLITEREVIEAALAAQGSESTEKFVQEVFWRSYFKGWLERRPSVWEDYKRQRAKGLKAMAKHPELAAAEEGRTGIPAFDSWVQELVETGYLHNHARMWFASIWIFTLRLPWAVGADFFMRHLLDGDPASNTLSWRWVAGLHTRGKHYLAKQSNINKFTANRPADTDYRLDTTAEPLTESFDYGDALPVRDHAPYDPTRPAALLLTEDDCHPESLGLDLSAMKAIAILASTDARSPRPVADHVRAFDEGAFADAASRLGVEPTIIDTPTALTAWAQGAGASQITTAFVPRGYVHDWLTDAAPALASADITLTETRRDWDTAVWPRATAGFFKVKKAIPSIFDTLDINE